MIKNLCLVVVASVLLYMVGITIYDSITVKEYDALFVSKGYIGTELYVTIKNRGETKEEKVEQTFFVKSDYSDIRIGKRATIKVRGARIPFTQKYPRIIWIKYEY